MATFARMPTAMLRVDRCPVCAGSALTSFGVGDGCVLQRCGHCDTVSATEYADPAEIYREGYLFGETEFGQGPGRWGMDIRADAFQALLARVSERRMDIIEATAGTPGAMLDIGCGTGETLSLARDRGWRVEGVEPERSAAEFARSRGLEVQVAYLEDAALSPASYDVVCAFHVLEHVPEPPRFLRDLAALARSGGLVVIEVPNFKSLDRRRNGANWRGLRLGEHITHFTPATLKHVLSSSGLEVLAVRAPTWSGPPQRPYDALAGFGLALAPEDAMVKALRGRRAPRFEAAGWLGIRLLDAVFDRAGVGMNLLAVARKGPASDRTA
jgi:SAM-dependent methyltransferase